MAAGATVSKGATLAAVATWTTSAAGVTTSKVATGIARATRRIGAIEASSGPKGKQGQLGQWEQQGGKRDNSVT